MDKTISVRKTFVFFIYVLIFAFFLDINYSTPLMGEDIELACFPRDYEITSLSELLGTMFMKIYNQMTTWNIRIGEQISIVFGCFDKSFFNFTNAFVSMLFFWLINQYAFKNEEKGVLKKGFLYCLSFAIVLLLQPVLGEIFFWRTGSTNYLWSICLLLGTCLPLRYYLGYDSQDIIGKSRLKYVILIIASFISSFTNENTVIVFIVLYIGVVVYDRIKKRKTPMWIYSAGVAQIIGFLCLYNAPSSKIRLEAYNEIFGITTLTVEDYFYRAINVIQRFFGDNFGLVVTTIGVMVLYWLSLLISRKMSSQDKRVAFKKSNENLVILCVSAISCGALIMSPYVETRAFLLPDFLMVVCIVYYFERLIDLLNVHFAKVLSVLLGTGLTLMCVCQAHIIKKEYSEYYEYSILRESAMSLCEEEDFLWGTYQKPYYSRILTTREDYLMDNEKRLSKYYGISVQCLKNYVWNFETEEGILQNAYGGFDLVLYEEETDSLSMWGWAALDSFDSDECMCYVYIDNGEDLYFFRTQSIEREDVADYLGNDIYLNCGFTCNITDITDFIEVEDSEEVKIGLFLMEESTQYYNNHIVEQEISFEEQID